MTSTDQEHGRSRPRDDERDAITEPVVETDSEVTDPDDELARALAERDEARSARQRALADFANFQRRSMENEQRALRSGAAGVVRSLLPALDNLDRALEADPSQTTVEQLRSGVRMVRAEIARSLESHGVVAIVPQRGDEFDPHRHEALMREAVDDVPPDHVTMTLQCGYAMGETILRPAKVALSQGT